MKFDVPEGFRTDTIDVSREYEQIFSVWPLGYISHPEIMRLRLDSLPSVCIRTEDGELATWEMAHSFSQLCHLFTLDEYRGKGLGTVAENLCGQIIARRRPGHDEQPVVVNVEVAEKREGLG
ncbi:hypothetical protein PMAYCL1PPCAC_05266 [Pristionchus mayeri]|uniref:Glycine N-acyltransferase-like protein n=1 Tax=Pristionchus mayeri TaxID=1317129 RepID=A0AAN4Z6K5_9BILA|nr:hypothetical protein PMAYCL1PPCAC_05266 [Pristionchus mayeri]